MHAYRFVHTHESKVVFLRTLNFFPILNQSLDFSTILFSVYVIDIKKFDCKILTLVDNLKENPNTNLLPCMRWRRMKYKVKPTNVVYK